MATYRNLVQMLNRNGCKSITLPKIDFYPFAKYVAKAGLSGKLKFEQKDNEFIITKNINAEKK